MKILVGIPHISDSHDAYLNRCLAEYRKLRDVVAVELFTEPPVKENPQSLVYAPRWYFSEHLEEYDLFIYTEDDILITERNIRAFLACCANCSEHPEISPSFLRVEKKDGKINYLDLHVNYRLEKPFEKNGWVFARCTNAHSGCYMLTREQLRIAITSGGYLVAPHSREGYGVLECGSADPYTQCGLPKLIPISRLDDFIVEHLPANYIDCMGTSDEVLRNLVETMLSGFAVQKEN